MFHVQVAVDDIPESQARHSFSFVYEFQLYVWIVLILVSGSRHQLPPPLTAFHWLVIPHTPIRLSESSLGWAAAIVDCQVHSGYDSVD